MTRQRRRRLLGWAPRHRAVTLVEGALRIRLEGWTGNSEATTIRLPCLRFRGSHVTAVIRTEKLTKSYGSHRGIVDVNLEVQKGEVFGFLGPNGAGKTTTIRILLDLIRPTSGKAFVFDIESSKNPEAIHRRVGYLPGEFALYDRLTGGQTLEYFGNLQGGVDRQYQAGLIERFDLDPSRRFG